MNAVYVSVVMPSLNVVDYIEKSLTSVLNQTLRTIEIICVDAGSTDGTLEVIKEYMKKDDRISLIISDYKSYGAQVNMGIDVSNGKYIAILETDDYIADGMYKALFDAAERNDCDYVKCNYYSFWHQKDGIPFVQKRSNLWDLSLYGKVIINPNPKEVCVNDLYLWDGIYKKDFLKRNNIEFSETEGAAFQDVSFLFQTSIFGKRIVYLNEAYYYYCTDRGDSSTNSDNGFLFSFHEYNLVGSIHRELINNNIDVAKAYYCRLALALYNSVNDATRIYGRSSKPYYDWFCNEIRWAVRHRIISDDDTNFNTTLESLLISYKDYVRKKESKNNQIIKTLGDIKNNKIVIFGCGNFGINAYRWLKSLGYNIIAFVDNDENKWERSIDSIKIDKPDFIDAEDESIKVIIANNLHAEEMRKQLQELNINSRRVCFF